MGSVWVAEHLTLDTEVAVKFMAPELATHPDMVARFRREAKAAARLRSPHVVKMFDYGLTKECGVPFMTMELLEGEDLEERVSRNGPLSAKESVEVVTQLAKALDEAHALGIVHRDVKPDNVFLTKSGDDLFVKVLDFGIAKQSSSSQVRVTRSGTTVGTPIYMSPEQILSAKDVDYRCDLWSLAVVAYFCLTGRVPFAGETFGAVCIAIDRGRMTSPTQIRGELPAAVDAWFAKALCRDIQGRFTSAKEMSETFADAMRGAPPSRSFSLGFTLPRRPRPRISRLPTLVGGTITAPPRSGARHRVTAVASVMAVMALALGAMDLGRVWFGRAALPVAAAASPQLAPAEMAMAPSMPPPSIARKSARIDHVDVVAMASAAQPEVTTVVIPPPHPTVALVARAGATAPADARKWRRREAVKPAALVPAAKPAVLSAPPHDAPQDATSETEEKATSAEALPSAAPVVAPATPAASDDKSLGL